MQVEALVLQLAYGTGVNINPLTPNDHYSSRTTPLTSKGCILYIYSTNIVTEYFKHGICLERKGDHFTVNQWELKV